MPREGAQLFFKNCGLLVSSTPLVFRKGVDASAIANPANRVEREGTVTPFYPMYSAQIRSSRTFRQKQIPSSKTRELLQTLKQWVKETARK